MCSPQNDLAFHHMSSAVTRPTSDGLSLPSPLLHLSTLSCAAPWSLSARSSWPGWPLLHRGRRGRRGQLRSCVHPGCCRPTGCGGSLAADAAGHAPAVGTGAAALPALCAPAPSQVAGQRRCKHKRPAYTPCPCGMTLAHVSITQVTLRTQTSTLQFNTTSAAPPTWARTPQ